MSSFAIVVTTILLYTFPWMLANHRRHPQQAAIGVLNIFLGWTVIGWIVALIWAATAIQRVTAEPQQVVRRPIETCGKCGARLPEAGARFCASCGTPLA
jgi:uncharacterized BrkB/YihY/UPF0761 family membrane protein